jgi:uncharacterized protein
MSREARYVLDTNVIISALLFETSKPAQALRYVLTNGKVLLSLDLLEELNDVIGRDRFNRYVTRKEREEFLEAFIGRASLIEIVETVKECRDSKDDKILELALNGKANSIISGDQDLLILNPFQGIVIVTAEEFLKSLF